MAAAQDRRLPMASLIDLFVDVPVQAHAPKELTKENLGYMKVIKQIKTANLKEEAAAQAAAAVAAARANSKRGKQQQQVRGKQGQAQAAGAGAFDAAGAMEDEDAVLDFGGDEGEVQIDGAGPSGKDLSRFGPESDEDDQAIPAPAANKAKKGAATAVRQTNTATAGARGTQAPAGHSAPVPVIKQQTEPQAAKQVSLVADHSAPPAAQPKPHGSGKGVPSKVVQAAAPAAKRIVPVRPLVASAPQSGEPQGLDRFGSDSEEVRHVACAAYGWCWASGALACLPGEPMNIMKGASFIGCPSDASCALRHLRLLCNGVLKIWPRCATHVTGADGCERRQ